MASDDKMCPDCHGWGVIRIVGGTQAQALCPLCRGSGIKQNAVPVTGMNLGGYNLTHSPALEGCRARCAELEAEASELKAAVREYFALAVELDRRIKARESHLSGLAEQLDAAELALRRLAEVESHE